MSESKTTDRMSETWARFLLTGPGQGYQLWHEMNAKEQDDLRYLADDIMKDDPLNDQGRR